jgi:hypothetical protein
VSNINLTSAATAITVSGSDVYLCGYGADTFSQFSQARYWKNGTEFNLTDGTEFAFAYGIAVSGNDVYVAGMEFSHAATHGNYIAKYWKNGVPVVLSDSNYPALVSGIAVSGNDIYVSGSITLPGEPYVSGVYWKNGVATSLSNGVNSPSTGQTFATGIAVAGSDVYVSGYQQDPYSQNIAMYWKNGAPVYLTEVANNGLTTGIAVAGNDVYVAGTESSGLDTNYNEVVKYWKNGVAFPLTPPTYARTGGITTSGGKVFTVGFDYNGTVTVARYWMNGVAYALSDSTKYNALASCIFVQ